MKALRTVGRLLLVGFLLSLLEFTPLLGGVAHAATSTLTIDGSQHFQTMDGFGVNANSESWKNGELKPAIDTLVNGGSTIWRVIIDNTDWEATNDDSDPNNFNWAYYNTVYSSPKFQDLWNTVSYLNSKGITGNIELNFMGPGPSWMGGSTLTAGMEDEWVEMISSLLYYARNTAHVQFGMVSPTNEQDLSQGIEGMRQTPAQYALSLNKLAAKLDAIGLSDIRFIGPDTADTGVGINSYMPAMMQYPAVMNKLDHFSFHDYSGQTGGADAAIKSSAYPTKNFWMSEFSLFTDGMKMLNQGPSAMMVWEGYDSAYNHPLLRGAQYVAPNDAGNGPALLSYDNSTGVYTPRKEYYQFSQLFKFVPTGSVRIGATASSGNVTTYAFRDPVSGRLTIVGDNTGSTDQPTSLSLSNVGTNPTSMSYYQTNSVSNMAQGADIPITNGTASFTAPANTIFTLTSAGSAAGPDTTAPTVSMTAPASGATVNGSNTVSATASDNVGVAGVQFKLDGANLGTESTSAPYTTIWDTTTATNGTHTLAAVARDAAGNTTTSSSTTVTVNNGLQTSPVQLLGNKTVQTSADSNSSGEAEGFRYTATAAGAAGTLSFYVDSGSAATSLKVGLYSDANNHPGSLLASGTVASPAAASWNTATFTSNPNIVNGSNYWIVFLGTGGTLKYRDSSTGSCSEDASSTSLTALPATWTSGQTWASCTISAYVTSTGTTTPPPADTQAPTAPGTLTASSTTASSTNLSWTAATDNVGVTGYQIIRDGTVLGTTTSLNYSSTGLQAGTTYNYSVKAFDAAGNYSTAAGPLAVTTLSPDTQAPTAPGTPTASNITTTTATLSWTAATDNVSVTGYQVSRNGTVLGTTAGLTYNDTGLQAGTTYNYTVKAYDAAGNYSTAAGPTVVTTTAPDTTAPTVALSAPAASSTVTGTTTVSANASDNVGVVGVQFKLDGANLSTEDISNPYSIAWDTTTATNGAHTLTAVARDAAGNATTSSSVSVTVNNTVTASPPMSTDVSVTTHNSSASSTLVSPAFSTANTNELLVAFIASDGPSGSAQTIKSVTGGGLTWTLAKRTNTRAGTSEVWTATASAKLTSAKVTATLNSGSYTGSITVVALTNAQLGGATGTANALTGAASVSLTTTAANSQVWAVGNDWDSATARTAGTGQTLVDQFLATATGDTYWVQKLTNPVTTSGTTATINDTAPTTDRWNYSAIEIVQKP